jgi:excisionase family DNA binding protein
MSRVKPVEFHESEEIRMSSSKKRRPRGPTDRTGALTYTVPEFARMLGIGRSQGYEAAKKGEIPVIRIGSGYRVPKALGDKMLGKEATEQVA